MRSRAHGLAAAGFLAAVGGFAWLAADHDAPSLAQPALDENAEPKAGGAAAFAGGGFDGILLTALETNASPFKLVAAALVLEEQAGDTAAPAGLATLGRMMQRFGFLYPDTVDSLPRGMRLPLGEKPLGMTHGLIAPVGGARVEVVNFGCAACHAGVA